MCECRSLKYLHNQIDELSFWQLLDLESAPEWGGRTPLILLQFVHLFDLILVQRPEDGGWGENLDGFVDIGRQRETAGDGGSVLLRVCRASTDEQETPGATGSNRKQEEADGSLASMLPNH